MALLVKYVDEDGNRQISRFHIRATAEEEAENWPDNTRAG